MLTKGMTELEHYNPKGELVSTKCPLKFDFEV